MAALVRDGTTLAYVEAGAGDPPCVFVHGWTCDRTYFAPQFEHLRRTRRVVAVDLLGHGESDAPMAGDYTIARFADDVAWMCGQLGLHRPIVIGHSMGAAVALELARRHRGLPAAIVMVDAAPIAIAPEVRPHLAALVDSLRGPDHDAVRRAFVDAGLFIDADDPTRRREIVDQMLRTPRHVAVPCMDSIVSWDGEAAAAACGVPALHIGAARPANDAATLRALNPLIQTAQTVGAGHFNQLMVPDQVNAMVDCFLAQLPVPTPA